MPSLISLYVWFALNFLACGCFLLLCLALHELGHAVTARLLGMQCIGIWIGTGPTLHRSRIGWLRIELRLFPFKAITKFCPATLRLYRTRRFLVIAAGPLTNLVLLGI